jgi:hypothetical protein
MMCELIASSAEISVFERYGALSLYSDLIEIHSGRDLPPPVRPVRHSNPDNGN